MSFHSYANAEQLVFEFERVLNSAGISIRTGSVLERVALNVIDLHEKHVRPELRPSGEEDVRPAHRDLVGMADLASKVVSACSAGVPQGLVSHLALLNETDAPLQNARASVLDQANNKLFELLIACLCIMSGADDVELDSPTSSKGNNPDVIARFHGDSWAFACKAVHGPGGMSIYENLKKAVSQIDRADVLRGIPVLSLKNILDHDSYWPVSPDTEKPGDLIFFAFPSTSQPIQMMQDFVGKVARSVAEAAGSELDEIFSSGKVAPGCLFYLPTVTTTWVEGNPIPTRLHMFNYVPFAPIDEATWAVATALNGQLQGMSSMVP